jgi:hypothetical protein
VRSFALGVRFWVGPDPVVGYVTPRGLLLCLDHCPDESGDAVKAADCFRDADQTCETCGQHVCAAYLADGKRPTDFAGDGSPRGQWKK